MTRGKHVGSTSTSTLLILKFRALFQQQTVWPSSWGLGPQFNSILLNVREAARRVPGMHRSSIAGGNVQAGVKTDGDGLGRGLLLLARSRPPGLRILGQGGQVQLRLFLPCQQAQDGFCSPSIRHNLPWLSHIMAKPGTPAQHKLAEILLASSMAQFQGAPAIKGCFCCCHLISQMTRLISQSAVEFCLDEAEQVLLNI